MKVFEVSFKQLPFRSPETTTEWLLLLLPLPFGLLLGLTRRRMKFTDGSLQLNDAGL
jgi:hypothetical protein